MDGVKTGDGVSCPTGSALPPIPSDMAAAWTNRFREFALGGKAMLGDLCLRQQDCRCVVLVFRVRGAGLQRICLAKSPGTCREVDEDYNYLCAMRMRFVELQ